MDVVPINPISWITPVNDIPPAMILVGLWLLGIFLWQARIIWITSGGTAQLSPDDLEELQSLSGFTAPQLKMLYKRFKRLDKDNSGSIGSDDLQSIPELAMNPLLPRILAIFDQDSTDTINFSRFVRVLSVFRPECDEEEKMEFMFRVYDIDGDGYISRSELLEVVKMCVGPNMREDDLTMIVDKTISEADTVDKDGKISREEFYQAVASDDVSRKLSVLFNAGPVTNT